MADLSQDRSLQTIFGNSTQEQAFTNTIETQIKPFFVAADQIDEILSQRIDPNGNINYELKPLNEQAQTQLLTGPLNCNGKRVENIGSLPDISSLNSILATPNTAANITTLSAFVTLYNALNTVFANPLVSQVLNMKGLRAENIGDALIPLLSDTPEVVSEKNKGVFSVGQQLDHFPSDVMKIRDPLDTEAPNRLFFDCDERVMQRAVDPVVDQDLVTLKYMKLITLNRGGISQEDFDTQNRRISSLLEPEEFKESMTQLQKNLQDNRAINQKFMRNTALSRLGVSREEPTGVFSLNNCFDAGGKNIQGVKNATKDSDAMPYKQATDKFLAKDGETIDVGAKKLTNGIGATLPNDLVIFQQLKDTRDQLEDLINNLGGGGGGSLLDVISLIASLTSVGTSLTALGLKAGTALTTAAQIGGPLLSGVLAMASVLNGASGQLVGSTALKVANGTSLNDYMPDPGNFAESQQALDRLRQGARDVEQAASQAANSIGGSWLNGIFQAPLLIQNQLLNPFLVI